MAATNFTPISLYYSSTASAVPTAGNLVAGELALNNLDGKLFYKDSAGVVQTMATKATTAGTYSSITTSNLTIGTTQLGAGNASIMKNRIINGAMVIDQRNAGAAVTSNNNTIFSVDRFSYFTNGSATGTLQQSSVAPSGFTNSLLYTITSGSASGSTTRAQLIQRIEGYNIADLAFGTASAKTITLSFWVRSSLTGTFGGSLQNSAQDRSYPYTYTISTANTWEQKTVTIAGDTSGTWLTTNGSGFQVYWDMGCGSSLQGTAGAWVSADYRGATGTTSVVATTGATWQMTGVQLEVGSSATGFEYRQYGQELALCQRYYYKVFPNATAKSLSGSGLAYSGIGATGIIQFPVTMRTTPSALEQSGTAGDYAVGIFGVSTTVLNAVPSYSSVTTSNLAMIDMAVASGLSAGYPTFARSVNAPAYLAWSAEL
jgi:hypothetical protein